MAELDADGCNLFFAHPYPGAAGHSATSSDVVRTCTVHRRPPPPPPPNPNACSIAHAARKCPHVTPRVRLVMQENSLRHPDCITLCCSQHQRDPRNNQDSAAARNVTCAHNSTTAPFVLSPQVATTASSSPSTNALAPLPPALKDVMGYATS